MNLNQADVLGKDKYTGSKKMSRVQSNEQELGVEKIDML